MALDRNLLETRVRERIADLKHEIPVRLGTRSETDERAFTALFNGAFKRQIPSTYYQWQFFRGPLPSACLFAEVGGETVGVYGIRSLKSGTGSPAMGIALEFIIAPAYQRSGLFALMELEMETLARNLSCACIYSSPNETAYRPRVSSLGWVPWGDRGTYLAPTTEGPKTGKLSFEPVQRFQSEIDEIRSAFQKTHPNRVLMGRTALFLNWRFAENPWYHYDLFVVRRGGELFGYLVLKLFRDSGTGVTFGDIVDLLWRDDDCDALTELLGFALRHFREHGVETAATWLQTGTALDEAGRVAGFVESEQKRTFCCRILDEAYSGLAEPTQWLITMVDAETIY